MKTKMYNGFEVKRTLISKRQLLTETAKALGTRFTIDDVKTVYRALQDTAHAHLNNANEYDIVTVNFGEGLSITSTIREVGNSPRMWLRAKISRHHNRTAVNEL